MPLTILLHGDPNAPHQARLGAALARRGHRIIVADAPGVMAQLRDEYGVASEPLRFDIRGPHLLRLLRLWGAVRMRGVDVVHLNYVRDLHARWADLPGGIPYVATAWGSDINPEVFQLPPERARAVDHALHHAGALTADSYQLLERTRARAKSDAPAELVLWGADLDVFNRERAAADTAAWRQELGIAPGQRVLLSPRQPQAHYHVDRILRAFATSRWRDAGVLLIKLHGRTKEVSYVESLRALTAALGVEDRVRFVPPCAYARLAGLYALADAAVSVPEADGWPATFCELSALGVPIIATDLPAYARLLEHDRSALLVPPSHHEALVKALDRLLDEPDLAPRLASAGLAFTREHGDFRRSVDRFEALYHVAIERHARAARGLHGLLRAWSFPGIRRAGSKHGRT
jgi:glycosyltransferase involved in cell wall biosynthesis